MPSSSLLHAIVYVSASVPPVTAASLEDLLLEARRLNRESGVTGALLHSDGSFMQYFEGTPDAVAATWERIRGSRRHTRITELMNEPVPRREFPDWEMALAQPAASELLALSTARWVVQVAGSGGRGYGSVGMSLLRSFWYHRRW